MTDHRNAMFNARSRAGEIAGEAHKRGWTAVDLFAAFAQVVAAKNPHLARTALYAIEKVVRARIPIIPQGPVMPIEVELVVPAESAAAAAAGEVVT